MNEDRRASFQQTCETARHYSQLRFVMMGVFTTVLGGALAINIQLGHSGPIRLVILLTNAGVIELGRVFLAIETRIASLVVQYQEAAASFPEPTLPLPYGHETYMERATQLVCRPLRLAQAFAAVCFLVQAVMLFMS